MLVMLVALVPAPNIGVAGDSSKLSYPPPPTKHSAHIAYCTEAYAEPYFLRSCPFKSLTQIARNTLAGILKSSPLRSSFLAICGFILIHTPKCYLSNLISSVANLLSKINLFADADADADVLLYHVVTQAQAADYTIIRGL